MEVAVKFPTTLTERFEYEEVLRVPASFEEFLDLLETCEYRIEYDNGEIISFMGFGTEAHEKLTMQIGRLLGNLLNEDVYSVYGSNLALHIPGFKYRYYNADCAVVKGASEKVTLRGSMASTANPVLLVEVLSPSTVDFDLGRKLNNYFKIPSLQQVLILETEGEAAVQSYTRHNGGDEWLRRNFTSPTDEIPVLNEGKLLLSNIYKNVNLLPAS